MVFTLTNTKAELSHSEPASKTIHSAAHHAQTNKQLAFQRPMRTHTKMTTNNGSTELSRGPWCTIYLCTNHTSSILRRPRPAISALRVQYTTSLTLFIPDQSLVECTRGGAYPVIISCMQDMITGIYPRLLASPVDAPSYAANF